METFETNSIEETYALGRKLAERFSTGDCVAMIGNLGAGKTAMVRGLAEGLGIEDPRLVSSPTYVLVQEYIGRIPIFHIDLYRMLDPQEEICDLGIDEMLEEGVVLVEWADKAPKSLPTPRWQLEIEITGQDSRRVQLMRQEASIPQGQ